MAEIIHYQVTDFLSLCDTECTNGTIADRAVTCPKCRAILATY